jgi:hypothetical protein
MIIHSSYKYNITGGGYKMYPRTKELNKLARVTSKQLRKVPSFVNEDIPEYLDDSDIYSKAHKHIQKFV